MAVDGFHRCERLIDTKTVMAGGVAEPGQRDKATRRILSAVRDNTGTTDPAEDATTSTRAEASLRCDLAYAHLARGDGAEAQTHATEARRLARRAGSVRQRRRINALLRHRGQTGF